MKLYFKKLYEDAITPSHGSEFSAGYDLYAHNYNGAGANSWTLQIQPHTTEKIGTGIAIAPNLIKDFTFYIPVSNYIAKSHTIPEVGWFGAIYPRSGLATKFGLAPANKIGVIDQDYRGEIIVALHNHSDYPQYISQGDRIAQFVMQPFFYCDWVEIDKLDETDRGTGGFGSTGV